MILLVLTGIKEELSVLLDHHPFEFEKDLRVYRSRKWPGLYAATTGPGVRHPGRVKKMIEELQPDVIINAGLVGILDERDPARPGDRLKLGQIVKAGSETIFPGGPGRDTLVTVDRPVHDMLDKMDLAVRYQARACDMEASKILEIAGSIPAIRNHSFIHFVKVAGDRPEEAALYEHEYMLRDWSFKSSFEKIRIMLQFPGGPSAFFKLRRSKFRSLQGLRNELFTTIHAILKLDGIPRSLGSTFIPH
jgi:hypothetical protein